jgi:hypothetical protein
MKAIPATMSMALIPPSPVGYGGQAEPRFEDPFLDDDPEPVMICANG